MFIRFAERGTAVFHDLCVIVRVVDVYQICRERNGCISMIYVLLLGLLMFIRFAERGTSVFSDLCVIVRVVDVYQICRERNGCVP